MFQYRHLFLITLLLFGLFATLLISSVASQPPTVSEDVSRPFFEYQIYNDTIIVDNDPVEPVNGTFGSYAAIFQKHGVCEKLLAGEIDEVWLWAGNGDGTKHGHLLEWTTSGPGWDKTFIDVPDCGEVVSTVTFNFTIAPNLHAIGHRLEGLFGHHVPCDLSTQTWPWNGEIHEDFEHCGNLLSDEYGFVARAFDGNGHIANCGDVHFPPNVVWSPNTDKDYDYGNSIERKTACQYWSQDGSANFETITCEEWNCNQRDYLIWWMQNFPGFENSNLDRNGNVHPNWWTFMFDGKYVGVNPPPLPTATPDTGNVNEWMAFLPFVANGQSANFVWEPMENNHIATLPHPGNIMERQAEQVEPYTAVNQLESAFKPVVLVIHLKAYEENGGAISPVEDQVNEIIQQFRDATTYHGYLFAPEPLKATFIGQDGADFAGKDCNPGDKNDNIHIQLTHVKDNVTSITVLDPAGGGRWTKPCEPGSSWIVHTEEGAEGVLDVYIKPFRVAPNGTEYRITVEYEEALSETVTILGTAVSP